MQLEELGSSKDVPPLSCRGIFGLSTIVENKVAELNHRGKNVGGTTHSVSLREFQVRGFHEVPD